MNHPFKVGDRVRMTERALAAGLAGNGPRSGTVAAAFERVLFVRRDGQRDPAGCDPDAWELGQETEAERLEAKAMAAAFVRP